MSEHARFGTVDSIRIDLPQVWTTIPIESNRTIATMLADHRDERRWALLSRTEQRRAELFAQQLDAYLTEGRVVLASYFCEIEEPLASRPAFEQTEPSNVERPEPNDDPYVVLGAVAVSVLTNNDLGTAARLSASLIQAAMATEDSDQDSRLLEVPQIVALPSGEAVVIRRSIRLGGPGSAPCFSESYLIPVEPAMESICTVSFVSPNTELAAEFSELAGAIAQTVRFYRVGEDTEL